MKCVVFDIWGDFGHYRKFYTTSSPLTFSIPPRTAIAGMIAAIIGLDKNEYLKYFSKDRAYIAIRLMNPVKKTRISYNLIDTKNVKMFYLFRNRTQVTFEVLKDCKYRIYFFHTDQAIYDRVKAFLEKHECYYTPCLGLSEYIADFEFIGEFPVREETGKQQVDIVSVIPFNEENVKIMFEENKEYFKDTLPNEMNDERETTEYVKVLYERNCKSISCVIDKFYDVEGEGAIVFL